MTVGFIGGSYIFDLGDAASMIRLSILVQRYSVEMPRGQSLHDQIFRKYVQLADIDDARSLMSLVKDRIRERKSDDFEGPLVGPSNADEFSRHFNAFEECAISCRDFYEDWGELKPVRVARIDMPAYLQDIARSFETIDALKDGEEPSWTHSR
jgi:hypothetical protein